MNFNSHYLRGLPGLTRRGLISRGPIVLAGIGGLCNSLAVAQSTQPAPSEFVEVKTSYGRVRGAKVSGDLATFKGIPYAGSVSGANRFKAAPPLKPWTDVRDALVPGPPSPQPGRTGRGNEPGPAEDCLVLNIWTPAADGRRRPVMFYSHGGGFTTGSGSSTYQDGGNLARTFDVVVVATNHRLGLMGYLYLGALGGEEYADSGNQGMLDIRDGLKWVHDNIEAFGGDPANVMIFGESGGGTKTSCLYAMPSAAPYFNKASIESGPGIRMSPKDVAAQTTLMLLDKLGIAKSDWRKILDVPVEQLVAAQSGLGTGGGGGGSQVQTGGRRGMLNGLRPGGFGPVVDGKVLPTDPFDPVAPAISKNKPLIVGFNRDEAIFFLRGDASAFSLTDDTLKARAVNEFGDNADAMLAAYRKSRPDASPSDIFIAMRTARMIAVGAITIAERKYAQHGAPAYMYIFAHESSKGSGVPHASEISYKFYNVRAGGPQGAPGASGGRAGRGLAGGRGASGFSGAGGRGGGGLAGVSGPENEKAAHNMAEMWSTFARTGRPAAKGQPLWPSYTTEKRPVMEIDAECKVVDDPYSLERQAWERLDP